MVLWIVLFLVAVVVAFVVLVVLARDGLRAISTFKEVATDLSLSFTKSSREAGQLPTISGEVDGVPVSATLEHADAQRGRHITLTAAVTAAAQNAQVERQLAVDLDERFDTHSIGSEEIVAERWNTTLEPAELRDDLQHIADAAAAIEADNS